MSLQVQMNNMKRQLMADKKKLSILVTMVLVGLLLWGRLLMQNVPKTATAMPVPRKATAATSSDKTAASATNAKLNVIEASLFDTADRDLFAVNGAGYPRIEKGEENSTGVTKSVVDSADGSSKAQAAIEHEAQGLKLQSTILGARPRAMINGTLVAPGETVQGFELVEIRPRAVTVKKDGVVVVLEM